MIENSSTCSTSPDVKAANTVVGMIFMRKSTVPPLATWARSTYPLMALASSELGSIFMPTPWLEPVGEQDAKSESDCREALEIDNRPYADTTDLGQIAGAGNTVHDDAKHNQADQHLDELDEAVTERLQLHRERGIKNTEQNTHDESNDDLDEKRFENVRHGFPPFLAGRSHSARLWSALRPPPLLLVDWRR